MKNGKLYVIEGLDGTGKCTQSKLLCESLQEELGMDKIRMISFPAYQSKTSSLVEMYLHGEFGKAGELSPYQVSSFFAVDRLGTYFKEMKPFLDDGGIYIVDRYTTSNLLYQSSLMDSEQEKKDIIDWIMDFEYKKLALPEPTQVFFLSVNYETFMDSIHKRDDNKHGGKDIHEENADFLEKVYKNANFVTEYLGWTRIECTKNGSFKDLKEIHTEILQNLQK